MLKSKRNKFKLYSCASIREQAGTESVTISRGYQMPGILTNSIQKENIMKIQKTENIRQKEPGGGLDLRTVRIIVVLSL